MKVRIETERLRLREYTLADLFLVSQLLGDATTMAHWPAPLDESQCKSWLERALGDYASPAFGRFGVVMKTGEFVGDAGIVSNTIDGTFENDLGYIIDHRYWGRGYGLEAARALRDFGHRHGMARIVANMATSNTPSVKVAEKLGMQLERVFINARNRNLDTRLYVSERTPA